MLGVLSMLYALFVLQLYEPYIRYASSIRHTPLCSEPPAAGLPQDEANSKRCARVSDMLGLLRRDKRMILLLPTQVCDNT